MGLNMTRSFAEGSEPLSGNIDAGIHIGVQGKPGPQGEDGGYYIPSAKQESKNELILEFSPTSAKMAFVEPVKIRLPEGEAGEPFTYDDFTPAQLEALKGANGFSPIVQVFPKAEVIRYPDGTMVTKEIGYTIRITDSEGYQDIDILHGDKGEKGADGTMTFEDLTDEQRESLRGGKGDKGDTGDSGVYILSEGETLEDAPEDVDVVYDPFFDTEAIPGGGIDVEGAVPGQTIAVKTVDANGKPTEWEAVDFPEGGGAKAFYVTITGKDGVYTADKTVEELNEAYNAGCALYAMVTAQIENFAVTNSVWNLANAADSWYVFSTIENRRFLSAFITSRGVSMYIKELAAVADLLNENGAIKQEYLPEGFPYKEGEVKAILTDSKPVDMDGMLILLDEVNLSVGEEYTVTWNGVEYKSVCFVFSEGEEYYNCLGNPGALGGEFNMMPFAIAAIPPEFASDDIGFGALLMPLDDSTDITISITGFVGTIQKIDEIYLPVPESDIFVITVTEPNGTPVSDKSNDEIDTALASGKVVVLKKSTDNLNKYFQLVYHNNGYYKFSRISHDATIGLEILQIGCSGDITLDTYSIPTSVPTVEDILAALPTWNGGSY